MTSQLALQLIPGLSLAELFSREIAIDDGDKVKIIDIKRADTALQCRKDFNAMVAASKTAKVKPHAITVAGVGMKSAHHATCYNFWWFSKNDQMYVEDVRTKQISRIEEMN